MFKRNSKRVSHEKNQNFMNFQKNLYKHHFWLVGQCCINLFSQALHHTSNVDTLQQLSCKISAKSANSFKSYATFLFFHLVGWLGWLGRLDSSSETNFFGLISLGKVCFPAKIMGVAQRVHEIWAFL